MNELKKQIFVREESIKRDLQRANQFEDSWFIHEVIKAFQVYELLDLKQRYQRLKRYLPQPKAVGRIDEIRIQRAREYPILEIAEAHIMNLKRSGNSYRALCPFHQESNPSFHIFPSNNNCHCFSCGAHQDVIGLTQKLLSCGFIEAVKHLTPYEK